MESAFRIEPTRLEDPTEAISDLVADLVSKTALLEKSLHSRTAFQLADLVRVTNTYHSNLIEGHNTRPLDIRRALEGKLDSNTDRRNLQLEAKAHYRVQEEIDQAFQNGQLPVPTSVDFIRKLHRDFYADAPEAMLRIHEADKDMILVPGEWRSKRDHDVQVGRHIPPSSESVPDFMSYFENAYDPKKLLTKTETEESVD
jgi:Fic family protein